MLREYMSFPGMLITHRQPFVIKEALINIAQTTLNNIDCRAQKRNSKNEIFQAFEMML